MNFLYDRNVTTGLITKFPSYNTQHSLTTLESMRFVPQKEIFTQESSTNKLRRLPFLYPF